MDFISSSFKTRKDNKRGLHKFNLLEVELCFSSHKLLPSAAGKGVCALCPSVIREMNQ